MEEGGAGSKLEGGLTMVDWEVEGERLKRGVSLYGVEEWAVEWAKMSMGLGVFDGPDHGVGWVLVLVLV